MWSSSFKQRQVESQLSWEQISDNLSPNSVSIHFLHHIYSMSAWALIMAKPLKTTEKTQRQYEWLWLNLFPSTCHITKWKTENQFSPNAHSSTNCWLLEWKETEFGKGRESRTTFLYVTTENLLVNLLKKSRMSFILFYLEVNQTETTVIWFS